MRSLGVDIGNESLFDSLYTELLSLVTKYNSKLTGSTLWVFRGLTELDTFIFWESTKTYEE